MRNNVVMIYLCEIMGYRFLFFLSTPDNTARIAKFQLCIEAYSTLHYLIYHTMYICTIQYNTNQADIKYKSSEGCKSKTFRRTFAIPGNNLSYYY